MFLTHQPRASSAKNRLLTIGLDQDAGGGEWTIHFSFIQWKGKNEGHCEAQELHGSEADREEDLQGSEADPDSQDFWSITGDHVIRTGLYVPKSSDFPIPLKYIGVTRRTETNLESIREKQ